MKESVTLYHLQREDIKIHIVARSEKDNLIIDGHDIGNSVEEAWEDSVEFLGPTEFKAQPVKFYFHNLSSGSAAANLVRLNDGYTHQDALNLFTYGISYGHHPSWTTEIIGVWRVTDPDADHVWTGNLAPGLYTLVSARIDPYCVWYVANLTISSE
jgi:hypothetical protein